MIIKFNRCFQKYGEIKELYEDSIDNKLKKIKIFILII